MVINASMETLVKKLKTEKEVIENA